jgi:predicted fused transcriptional regulator/phosphomethylpyrimidine kinase
MRAVGCIRLNEDIAETVREVLQDVEEYDAEKFPKGISTMEWGVAFLCKEGVPAAICAENEPTYGGCIYIFGETPDDVANRILIISERLTL